MMKMSRLVRVVGNTVAGVMLLILALAFLPTNPLLTGIFLLVAYDQFEDLYYLTAGIKPKRRGVYKILNVFYEVFCIGVGVLMLIFCLNYFLLFYSPFFLALILTSIVIIISGVEDLVR